MRKILIVLGPTAVGKTALSVQIAQEFDGHIISADSIQVYKGLDIISGKEKDSYGNIPVSLLDIASPLAPFNISDYITHLKKVLSGNNSHLPIVTGGSAFYISALINNVDTVDIRPDQKLRKSLEFLSVEELRLKLQEINSKKLESMNNSDRNNSRRLIRAIEISSMYKVDSSRNDKSVLENFSIKIIGLTADTSILDERVDVRVGQRIKQGALNEAKDLFAQYDLLAPQVKTASGYKQLFEHLSGMYTLEVGIEKWKIAEHQNVRKQMTWFKKMKNIDWFNIQEAGWEEKAKKLVSDWFTT